jgi:predicted MFS family arabinose efflux permease
MPPTAGMLLFLGPALGPTAGGALIGVLGWRSIFLINVPVGLAAAAAIRRIPADLAVGPADGARLDRTGLLLLATGLALLLLGTGQGGAGGWATLSCWLPLAAGAVLLAGYAAWSRQAEQPALDLSLARNRAAALALTLCAAASVVTFAAVFLLPVFMQAVQGHSPLAAGLAMLPQGLMTGLSASAGQRVLRVITIRTTVLTGFAILTAGSAGLVSVGVQTPLAVTAALLAARSAAIGLVISPLLAVLTGSVQQQHLGDATTLFSVWQRIAGSLGVGLIASAFARQAAVRGPVAALHLAGVMMAAVAAIGLLAATMLPRRRDLGPAAS